jgi:hypothetical protein
MHPRSLTPLLSCLAIIAVGCGETTSHDPDDDIAEAEQAIVSVNALGANALGANALGANALGANALGANALGANALGANALGANSLAALKAATPTGAQNRQFVQYTVSCALTSSQSYSLSWTDSAGVVHDEVYWGLLGLAPGWVNGPLTDETQQRMVSACLAARTNWYGVTVMISLRSVLDPLRTQPTSQELVAYSHAEGAFWGNIFGPSPALYTCFEAGNVSLARSAYRDCAAGHLDPHGQPVQCGIINIVGSCAERCGSLDPLERWYNACSEPGAPPSPAVIAVALP